MCLTTGFSAKDEHYALYGVALSNESVKCERKYNPFAMIDVVDYMRWIVDVLSESSRI